VAVQRTPMMTSRSISDGPTPSLNRLSLPIYEGSLRVERRPTLFKRRGLYRSTGDKTVFASSGSSRTYCRSPDQRRHSVSLNERTRPKTFTTASSGAGPTRALVRHGLSRCTPAPRKRLWRKCTPHFLLPILQKRLLILPAPLSPRRIVCGRNCLNFSSESTGTHR